VPLTAESTYSSALGKKIVFVRGKPYSDLTRKYEPRL